MSETLNTAFGYVLVSLVAWSAIFTFVVFGVMLRRKILLWDDKWKETVVEGGVTIQDYADDLERTHAKVRATFRWLGFFLFVFACLMGGLVYQGFLDKPIVGVTQTTNGLWLLAMMVLSILLPGFVSFGIGSYLVEAMFLKANIFVLAEAREEMKERKTKLKMMEQAKIIKEKREAAKAAAQAAAAQTAAAKPGTPAPAAPAAKK